MKTGKLLALSLVVIAAMTGFAFWAAAQLPTGAELPTHWNARGEVDDTMPALQALLMGPILLTLTAAIFALLPRLEPLQRRMEGSAPLLRASWLLLIGFTVFIQLYTAAPVFGYDPEAHLVLVAVGLLLIGIGNVLPKSRPGFFVGIRTPWTLIDTDTWIATHRLGGKTFMAGGAVLVIAGLLEIAAETRSILTIAAIVVAAAVPVVFSWWFWQSGRGGGDSEKRENFR